MGTEITLLIPHLSSYPYTTDCGLRFLSIQFGNKTSNSNLTVCGRHEQLGFSVDSALLIIQFLNSQNHSFTVDTKIAIERRGNGSLDSYLLQIQKIPNSCSIPYFTQTRTRNRLAKASYPVYYLSKAAFYAERNHDRYLFTVLNIFRLNLWVALGIYFSLLKLFQYLKWTKCRFVTSVKNSHFGWLAIFTALFVGLFRSGLLSNLLVSKDRPWFTNLAQLKSRIEAKEAELVSYQGSSSNDIIKSSFGVTPEMFPTRDMQVSFIKLNPEFAVGLSHEVVLFFEMAESSVLQSVRLRDLRRSQMVVYCNKLINVEFMRLMNNIILANQNQLVAVTRTYVKKAQLKYSRSRFKTYKRYLRAIKLEDYLGDFLVLIAIGIVSVGVVVLEKIIFFIVL